MNLIVAVLRRHVFLAIAVIFAAYFAFSAFVNGDRLSKICNAFAVEDALVRRAVPAESPWKQEIDEKRQAVAAVCDTYFAEQIYPVDPENR